jgi:hypothetical protein
VLDPYADAAIPLQTASRKALLASLVGAYCEHRLVLIMLLRDVSSHWPLHVNPQISGRIERFVELLAGARPTSDQRVVVDAVLGVITRPLIDPVTDTDDEPTCRLILAIALDVAKRLRNETSRSWADRRASV